MVIDKKIRQKRKKKAIRKKIRGSAQRPRLTVYKSCLNIYAQLIDDDKGVTLCSASTMDSTLKKQSNSKCNIENAKKVGELLIKRAKEKKITSVVFDRNGYKFHGRIKAIAEVCQKAGILPQSKTEKKA